MGIIHETKSHNNKIVMPKVTDRTRKKQETLKMAFLEIIEGLPIIAACKKLNIARATYYNWIKKDAEFADLAEEALMQGRYTINDLAESKLISKINEGSVSAIIFWLKHNCNRYRSKVEIEAYMQETNLSEEQKKLIWRGLRLTEPKAETKKDNNQKNEKK